MFKQKGYTFIEMAVTVVFVLSILMTGGIAYIAWHFISKIW